MSKIKIAIIIAILVIAGYYLYNIYTIRVQIDSGFNSEPTEQEVKFQRPTETPHVEGPGGSGLPPTGE